MDEKSMITTIYPAVRQFTADTGKISRDKHYMRTLLEVDVSNALRELKAMRTRENKVSFLAWFIHILGTCVANHPPIDGVRQGKRKVISFKDVDISTIVEKQVEGVGVPIPLVLRDVNHQSIQQVEQSIRSAIEQKVESEGNYVLGEKKGDRLMRLAAAVPQWIRLFFMRVFMLNNPKRLKAMMGTVMVTSLGMRGNLTGWIIPTSMHPLSIGIGSLSKKAAIYKGEIQKRDILHLTIAIDHDVVDGMPALRFVDELMTMIEMGTGLDSA